MNVGKYIHEQLLILRFALVFQRIERLRHVDIIAAQIQAQPGVFYILFDVYVATQFLFVLSHVAFEGLRSKSRSKTWLLSTTDVIVVYTQSVIFSDPAGR